MTRAQAVLAVALLLLMATAGAVWQFGAYGLYGGALAGLVALTFIDVDDSNAPEKGGEDG